MRDLIDWAKWSTDEADQTWMVEVLTSLRPLTIDASVFCVLCFFVKSELQEVKTPQHSSSIVVGLDSAPKAIPKFCIRAWRDKER